MNDFNEDKSPLVLREYGRNVQKLVNYVKTIEDKEKRTRFAETLVDLMKMINPNTKDYPEYTQKVWDDLYIMAGFELEVDGPFPMPEKSILGRKPRKMDYNTHNVRFKHYGKNVELMIQKALALEDAEEREAAVISIGKLMKTFQLAWNRDNVDDEVILQNIEQLSKGDLTIGIEKVKEQNLFDPLVKEREFATNQPRQQRDNNNRGGNNNRNKRNFQKRRRN
ncbi:DUF4290 domain-containing protein [uncultured Imperialibacter sp.]|uniref:DUF4290 domain-containing protein n=1 Tax=uncultured Imperialibacter sp. TaxID=1672639 RepID=UPI0030DCC908|tara:strand:+ start:30883 stop:31551 length:669 start_codon:yes stop_codon:yes gene_type:complete